MGAVSHAACNCHRGYDLCQIRRRGDKGLSGTYSTRPDYRGAVWGGVWPAGGLRWVGCVWGAVWGG